MKNDRRDFLKTGAAALVAASAPVMATAQHSEKGDDSHNQPRPIYLNGCGWNRSLPGVFGQACFVFEARAEVGGTGVGTIRDDVYPEINSQFRIDSVTRQGRHYRLRGEIIASRSPELVGMLVTIDAESLGSGEGSASITVESEGNNLVVIAIIAILIGLLVPSIQR
jgi:hypothetical protein